MAKKRKPKQYVSATSGKEFKRKPSGNNNLLGGMSGRAESAIRQRKNSNKSALATAKKHTRR